MSEEVTEETNTTEEINSSASVPTEIPWKLAATTHSLQAFDGNHPVSPPGSSISLLTHTLNLENFRESYPDDRLVYFKIPISISSDVALLAPSRELAFLFSGSYPVWTSVVDVRISQKGDGNRAAHDPYFIAASPARREMIESGIFSTEVFEGVSGAVGIGKSASQMHESLKTTTDTQTQRTSAGGTTIIPVPLLPFPVLAGGGVTSGSSSTVTSATNDILQLSDLTTRSASEERRELLSHTTNVRNVLTLLTSNYVGSPYLQFILRPRPLHLLALDPADPQLWYTEFLRRRSLGIQGTQDFYAISVLPVTIDNFCIHITLRNVYVYDNPPVPPEIPPGDVTSNDIWSILAYLDRIYPRGTPIDELDFDFSQDFNIHSPELAEGRRNSVIRGWWFGTVRDSGGEGNEDELSQFVVFPLILSPYELRDGRYGLNSSWFYYKTAYEVKLEMQQWKYQRELARSPLERGVIFYITRTLRVCFSRNADGGLSVTESSTNVSDPEILLMPDIESQLQSFFLEAQQRINPTTRVMVDWNFREDLLMGAVIKNQSGITFNFENPKVRDLTLERLQNIDPLGPLNKSVANASKWLGLDNTDLAKLRKAGVANLQGLAEVLNNIKSFERLNRQILVLPKERSQEMTRTSTWPRAKERILPSQLTFPISSDDADRIRSSIAKAFQSHFGPSLHMSHKGIKTTHKSKVAKKQGRR